MHRFLGVVLAYGLGCSKATPTKSAPAEHFTCYQEPHERSERECVEGYLLDCKTTHCFEQDHAYCFSAQAGADRFWICRVSEAECVSWRSKVETSARQAGAAADEGPCVLMSADDSAITNEVLMGPARTVDML